MKKVSQRNAPGAISAIALTVNPVRPSVEGGFGAAVAGDIRYSFFWPGVGAQGRYLPNRLHQRTAQTDLSCTAEPHWSCDLQISPVLRHGFGWCRPPRPE